MQLKNVQKLKSVAERDIDMLLLEEFNVSTEFSSWFYSKVTGKTEAPGCIGAWHSVSDSTLGESDLVVLYDDDSAILIENKIDAVAQPDQGERYTLRGKKGVEKGQWLSFQTCMVAPDIYLQKEHDSRNYDAHVSYEELNQWFLSAGQLDKRNAYKAHLLEEAIAQNRRGHTFVTDQQVTLFWLQYWQFATSKYPELEMKRPGNKPSNADWPDFRPASMNKRFSIVHKLSRGDLDLQISGAAESLDLLKEYIVDSDIKIEKANKSAAVRIKVPAIDCHQSFDSQMAAAELGMQAALRLLAIGYQLERIPGVSDNAANGSEYHEIAKNSK